MNFVLFEFSTQVTIDRAFLDSIVGDSDMSVWIGTADNPFHNHLTLSDSVLSGIGFVRRHQRRAAAPRGGPTSIPDGVQGNVLVIAADTD